MTTFPPILRGLTHTQATVVLTAYEEDGIHPTSLDGRTWAVLMNKGFLRSDKEGFLVVTQKIRRALDQRAKL